MDNGQTAIGGADSLRLRRRLRGEQIDDHYNCRQRLRDVFPLFNDGWKVFLGHYFGPVKHCGCAQAPS
jgi:hypothetical protein